MYTDSIKAASSNSNPSRRRRRSLSPVNITSSPEGSAHGRSPRSKKRRKEHHGYQSNDRYKLQSPIVTLSKWNLQSRGKCSNSRFHMLSWLCHLEHFARRRGLTIQQMKSSRISTARLKKKHSRKAATGRMLTRRWISASCLSEAGLTTKSLKVWKRESDKVRADAVRVLVCYSPIITDLSTSARETGGR
jgi:hypothetical protein